MINTAPLQQLIKLIKSAELSRQTEVKIPITQARLISLSIAELLAQPTQQTNQSSPINNITLNGGQF